MKFSLCRFSKFLDKKTWLRILVQTLVFVALCGVFTALSESTDEASFFEIIYIPLICHIISSFFEPSEFEIEDKEIKLVEYHCEDYKQGVTFLITKPHRFAKRAIVKISRIEKIEYASNFFERLFNLGHIKIQGSVRMEKKNQEPFYKFDVPQTHCIRGIKHFKTVKLKIEQLFPNAEHCEI
ncbi:MAG: PH domain-containing protein [Clostridia bacterium]|nr:PH domain-containing protein [Clostridia bacterium]